MCLINFHYDDHPTYKLIVAANRDEFYERPTVPAEFWTDHPNILAGRDLLHRGTWLGVTKSGRFAALTNYRDPQEISVDKISRGNIVASFLSETVSPEEYLKTLKRRKMIMQDSIFSSVIPIPYTTFPISKQKLRKYCRDTWFE